MKGLRGASDTLQDLAPGRAAQALWKGMSFLSLEVCKGEAGKPPGGSLSDQGPTWSEALGGGGGGRVPPQH